MRLCASALVLRSTCSHQGSSFRRAHAHVRRAHLCTQADEAGAADTTEENDGGAAAVDGDSAVTGGNKGEGDDGDEEGDDGDGDEDDDGDDESDESDESDETSSSSSEGEKEPVILPSETLLQGRQRRHTAGKRMAALLNEEDVRCSVPRCMPRVSFARRLARSDYPRACTTF
jgi:hypothetical protein